MQDLQQHLAEVVEKHESQMADLNADAAAKAEELKAYAEDRQSLLRELQTANESLEATVRKVRAVTIPLEKG